MLNLLPAILVSGPPNSGKSVLFYHLTQALRERKIPHHAIRACPDGDNNWFHEGHPVTMSEIRVSHGKSWPTSFVQRISQDLEHRCLPFLVDIGGRPRDSDQPLLELCTHSIALHRQDLPEDIQIWNHLIARHDLIPLAQLYSQQTGTSVITATSPVLQGIIVGLERQVPLPEQDIPLFNALVDSVSNLFLSYNLNDLKKDCFDYAPTELPLDLEISLQDFTTTSSRWEPAMLQPYLASIPRAVPLSVYGVGPNWLYAALSAHTEGQPFYLFDPKLPFGWVQPAQLVLDGEPSPELSLEMGSDTEVTVLKIAFPQDRIEYFQPEPLPFPSVNPDKGLIIDGRAPYWLLTALVRFYQAHGVAWIAPFSAGQLNQAVVAYSRVEKYSPGTLLPKPLLSYRSYTAHYNATHR